jgi:3-oxoacyl-[acyl-carrier protein] reductase
MNANPWNMQSAIVPITGAASGLGLAMCKRLRAEGATPLMLDVNGTLLEQAVHEVYREATKEAVSRYGYVVDVRDSVAVEACFSQIRRVHGLVTHAVSNAGVLSVGHALEVTDDEWRRAIDVNLTGAFFFCRAAARHLTEAKRGAIVAVASISGLTVKPERVSYSASKAGVVNMVRALALDLGSFGVRVNGVAPGVVHTPIQVVSAESLENSRRKTALGRLGTPEDIANVVLFLLSDLSSYITAQTIVIDGGLTSRYN